MNQYPMVFRYKNWIQGTGFAAGIELEGRVLLSKEDDEWWISGVTPGGMSEAGADPKDAYTKFRTFFTGILTDLAHQAGNFGDFEAQLRKFMAQTNVVDAKRWDDARAYVKAGGEVDPLLGGFIKLTDPVPPRLIQCVQLLQKTVEIIEPEDLANYVFAQAA